MHININYNMKYIYISSNRFTSGAADEVVYNFFRISLYSLHQIIEKVAIFFATNFIIMKTLIIL